LAPAGFCGRAASLEAAPLLDLYARGMVPGGLFGLPAAWSPPVRAVLRLAEVSTGAVERRSRKACRVSLDEGFDSLLGLCARRSPAIEATPALDLALGELYEAGFAHSLEIHDRDGVLLAGLIGVAAGGVFTIERVYAESDEAFARGVESLGRQLRRWNFDVIDFKAPGRRSALLPCVRIDRAAFCELAAARACAGRHGRWRLDADLRDAARHAAVPAVESSSPARRSVA
jgi:Leu/Phe-tRNA-protein transferase